MSKLHCRSVFISDVHLGTKNCKAAYLLDFLKSIETDYLYLVGDIFDIISMKKKVYWNTTQTEIIQQIFRLAKDKTRVIYIPGNHDHFFRSFDKRQVNGVKIKRNAIHKTAAKKRLFVSHGDEFDTLVKHSKLMYWIGDWTYTFLLRLNQINDAIRKSLSLPYWSLSTYLKSHSKKAEEYISRYQQAAVNRARSQNYDGYICGHIHKSGISFDEDTLYCNTGDWVEHCTALIEEQNGHLKILHWSDHAAVKYESTETEALVTDIPLLVPLMGKISIE